MSGRGDFRVRVGLDVYKSLQHIRSDLRRIQSDLTGKGDTLKVQVGLDFKGGADTVSKQVREQIKVVQKDAEKMGDAMEAGSVKFNNAMTSMATAINGLDKKLKDVGSLGSSGEGLEKKYRSLKNSIGGLLIELEKGKLSEKDFRESMSGIRAETKLLEGAFNSLKNESNLDWTSNVEKSSRALKELESISRSIKNEQAKLSSAEGTPFEWDATQIRRGYGMLLSSVSDLSNAVQEGSIGQDEYRAALARTRESQERLKASSDEMWRSIKNSTTEFDWAEDTKKSENALRALEAQIDKVQQGKARLSVDGGVFPDDVRGGVEATKSSLDGLEDRLKSLKSAVENGAISYKDYEDGLAKARRESENLARASKEFSSSFIADKSLVSGTEEYYDALTKLNTLLIKVTVARQKWTAAESNKETVGSYNNIIGYQIELENLRDDLKKGEVDIDQFNSKLTEISAGFSGASEHIKTAGMDTTSFGDRTREAIKKFSSWLSVSAIVMKVVHSSRQMVAMSIELDDAMTQLRIVTLASEEAMSQYGDSIAKTAQRIGASITDLVDATTTYARLGYSLNESSVLAEYTAMLQNVGGIQTSDAQDAITSIIKAFDIGVNEVESVMDKLVMTGNNFPISVEQIAEGMTNASSALSASGNSFEQSVALMTAANTTIQNAAKSSTGLRTIAARIRKTKSELDDLGEVMSTSAYNKMVSALSNHNVQLVDANNEYRSTYDIMKDIAAEWENLTNMEQSAIATQLAGTRQQAVFFSIIEQFQEAEGAYNKMQESVGALQTSYDEYMDSATAHINMFKSTYQELAANLFQSDLIAGAADLGTTILRIVDALVRSRTLLLAIAGTVGSIAAIRKGVNSASTMNNIVSGLVKEKQMTSSLAVEITKLSSRQKDRVKNSVEASVATGMLNASQGQAITSSRVLTASQFTLSGSIKGVTASIKSLMASIPVWGWIALGISAAVTAITYFTDKAKQAAEAQSRLNEEFSSMSSNISQTANTYKDTKNNVEGLAEGLDKLRHGLDESGKAVSLNEEETREYHRISNEIATLLPELSLGVDEYGNAMLRNVSNVEEFTNVMKELLEEKRKLAAADVKENLPDLFGTGEEIISGHQANIKQWNRDIDEYEALVKRAQEAREYMRSGVRGETFDTNLIGDLLDIDGNIIFDSQEFREIASNEGFAEVYTEVIKGILGDSYSGGFLTIDQIMEVIFHPEFDFRSDQIAHEVELEEAKIKSVMQDLVDAYTKALPVDNEFDRLPREMQNMVLNMIHAIDPSQLESLDLEDFSSYVKNNIIRPLSSATEEAMVEYQKNLDKIKADLAEGRITDEEFSQQSSNLFIGLIESSNMASEHVGIFKELFVSAFGESGASAEDFANTVATAMGVVSDSTGNGSSLFELPDFSESVTEANKLIEITKSLQDEMLEKGSLSAKSIEQLSSVTDDYMDYLYEENGLVKLNVEAWQEYIDTINNVPLEGARASVEALRTEVTELQRELSILESGEGNLDESQRLERIAEINRLIEENTLKIQENQDWINLYQHLLAEASDSAADFLDKVATLDAFKSSVDEINGSLNTLADLQELVANSFTLTLDEAMKFASIYPEIMSQAEMTADGQVRLNEDVVNSMISGKEAEVRAGVDASIAKLQAEREVVEGKLMFAQAQLDIVNQVGQGEAKISKEVALYKINLSNESVKLLMDALYEEGEAHRLTALAMAGNEEEFRRVAVAAASKMSAAHRTAAYEAAEAIYKNFQNAGINLDGFIKKAHNAAEAVAGVGSGEKRGVVGATTRGIGGTLIGSDVQMYDNGYGTGTVTLHNPFVGPGQVRPMSSGIDMSSISMKFNSLALPGVSDKGLNIGEFKTNLENIIAQFGEKIDSIDGQIAMLEMLRDTDLEKFSSDFKKKQAEQAAKDRGESGGGSKKPPKKESSSKPKKPGTDKKDDKNDAKETAKEVESEFARMYKKMGHLRNMDEISAKEYFVWLNDAYKVAFVKGEIALDDYRKYREEVYKGMMELFKDYMSDIEHEISMRSNFTSETPKVLKLYEGLVKDVQDEIARARGLGLDDTDNYIQELQNKWWSYTKSIKEIRDSVTKDAKSNLQSLIDFRIKMIERENEEEVKEQKDTLNKRLEQLKEFYDKQKKLLDDQNKEESYLEEQAEKRKELARINAEMNQLEHDDSAWATRRKLELASEYTDAQKELDKFEKDHALETAKEKLDELYEQQASAIERELELVEEKQMTAKELYDQALNDIKNGSVQLYEDMIEYNNVYGDGIAENITEMWEDAYKALDNYRALFGEHYKDVELANATKYEEPKESWDKHVVSGTAPSASTNNPNASTSKPSGSSNKPSSSATSTPKPSGTTTGNTSTNKPSLARGGQVTVKKSATHFGSKSRNARMLSFVPGGSYTVYETAGNQVLIGRNGVYTGWINKKDIVGYARGTRNAIPGLHAINEEGYEHIFESKSGDKYKLFSGGEKVLNAQATEFLYDFALKGAKGMLGGLALNGNDANGLGDKPFEIKTGDINIYGDTNERTVSEIRRAQRDGVSDMLKEFARLRR